MNTSGETLVEHVNEENSGYAGTVKDWKQFLGCWIDHVHPPADIGRASVLQGTIKNDRLEESRTFAEIDAAEKRLAVKLPKSYREFISAFAANQPPDSHAKKYIGLLPVNQIGFVRDLMPESAEVAEENPIDAVDSRYFIYGVDQDDVAVRTRYLRNALLIGMYGDSMHEQILLYPQVSTQDGEWEAAIRFHSGEFRTPSFAEMMRQWSYLERFLPSSVPPYSQDRLRDTCADRLPMRNVWWR